MKEIKYFLQVFLVSLELLFFLLILLICISKQLEIGAFLESTKFNEEAIKWVTLYPLGICGWVLKDGSTVLFPDDKTNKILHDWPDYWRLKTHFHVGIIYSILFVLPCFYIWLTGEILTIYGVAIFLSCSIACSINAFSFFQAKIKIKEILIHAK